MYKDPIQSKRSLETIDRLGNELLLDILYVFQVQMNRFSGLEGCVCTSMFATSIALKP